MANTNCIDDGKSVSGGVMEDLIKVRHKPLEIIPTARRPMNAFLIFCKRYRSVVKQRNPALENRAVTKILGEWWADLEPLEKQSFVKLAQQYKEAFIKENPEFKWYRLPSSLPIRNQSLVRPANQKVPLRKLHCQMSNGPITLGKLADESQLGGLSSLFTNSTRQTIYDSSNCHGSFPLVTAASALKITETCNHIALPTSCCSIPPKPFKKRFVKSYLENEQKSKQNQILEENEKSEENKNGIYEKVSNDENAKETSLQKEEKYITPFSKLRFHIFEGHFKNNNQIPESTITNKYNHISKYICNNNNNVSLDSINIKSNLINFDRPKSDIDNNNLTTDYQILNKSNDNKYDVRLSIAEPNTLDEQGKFQNVFRLNENHKQIKPCDHHHLMSDKSNNKDDDVIKTSQQQIIDSIVNRICYRRDEMDTTMTVSKTTENSLSDYDRDVRSSKSDIHHFQDNYLNNKFIHWKTKFRKCSSKNENVEKTLNLKSSLDNDSRNRISTDQVDVKISLSNSEDSNLFRKTKNKGRLKYIENISEEYICTEQDDSNDISKYKNFLKHHYTLRNQNSSEEFKPINYLYDNKFSVSIDDQRKDNSPFDIKYQFPLKNKRKSRNKLDESNNRDGNMTGHSNYMSASDVNNSRVGNGMAVCKRNIPVTEQTDRQILARACKGVRYKEFMSSNQLWQRKKYKQRIKKSMKKSNEPTVNRLNSNIVISKRSFSSKCKRNGNSHKEENTAIINDPQKLRKNVRKHLISRSAK